MKAEHGVRAIESLHIPRALAAAFLAALAVAIAQTIYQIFAPETVRRMTLDEFVASQKEDYGKHPTPSAVHDARESLRRLRGVGELRLRYFKVKRKKIWRRRGVEEQLSRKSGEELDKFIRRLPPIDLFELRERYNIYPDLFSSRVNKIEDVYQETLDRIAPELRQTLEGQVNMSLVSQAARQTYLDFASKNRLATVFTAAIYLIAVYMIGSVLVNQTSAVLESSNIHSIGETIEWWRRPSKASSS